MQKDTRGQKLTFRSISTRGLSKLIPTVSEMPACHLCMSDDLVVRPTPSREAVNVSSLLVPQDEVMVGDNTDGDLFESFRGE